MERAQNLMGKFEKYIPLGRGRHTKLSQLRVGEYLCAENKTKKDFYQRIYQLEKRLDRSFEFQICVNGIVIRRIV
jgi:hypothetical protein